MTQYVVLQAVKSADATPTTPKEESWRIVATLDAANARAAVAAAVKNNGATAGSYVATPIRSFKTVTVTSESTVHIKIT